MSFTTNVKNEVSKLEVMKSEMISELSAIINTTAIIDNNILVSTENASIARRVYSLVKYLYNINPSISVRRNNNFNKNYKYSIIIKDNVSEVLEDIKVIEKNSMPSEDLVGDDELKKAYIRGLFFSVGSINDPKKSRYHLEFIFIREDFSNFVSQILNDFDLNSKVLKRDKKYMVYVKEAEKISDFLRIIKASQSLLYFEDIRIYRDHKNMTNRLNNCEQANVNKIVKTAYEQVDDIELIEKRYGLDIMNDKLKQASIYRKKYPDVSLSELGEIISLETGDKITKSGLYHRFDKIKKLANKIREKDNID